MKEGGPRCEFLSTPEAEREGTTEREKAINWKESGGKRATPNPSSRQSHTPGMWDLKNLKPLMLFTKG